MSFYTYGVRVIHKNGTVRTVKGGPYYGDWLDKKEAQKVAHLENMKPDVALAEVTSSLEM